MRISTSLLAIAAAAAFPLFAAEPSVIELKNGTKIVGAIQKQEGGKVYIDAELLGPLVVDASALAAAPAPSSPAAEAAAAAATPERASAAPIPVASGPGNAPATPAAAHAGRVVWKRMISVSGSYNSAAYEQGAIPGVPASAEMNGSELGLSGKQSTVQLNGMIMRATPTLAVALTGAYSYAKYEPAGRVLDAYSGELTVTRILSPKTYALSRSTYKVDQIALIDRSFEQVVGYGFKLVDTDRTKLDVIPGLSEVNEIKGTKYDRDWILSGGFLENCDFIFNERVTLHQRFKYRVGLSESEVWTINSYLGIESKLTAQLSLNVGLTYTYDNTLGPLPPSLIPAAMAVLYQKGLPVDLAYQLKPGNKAQLQMTTGLQFKW
jgi:hypothetical protein